MKKQFLILLFLFPLLVNAQSKEAKSLLDTVMIIMKVNAFNSKEVDWTKLTKEAYRLAENAKSPYQLGNSIRYLYQALDDFHGSFRYKDSTFRWMIKEIPESEAYKIAFGTKGNKFFTKQLGAIGYLRIPSTRQEIAKERTRALQDSLCKILKLNPKGLIFDLRLNGGGHVFSMVMGVSNIMEYGPVGPGDQIKKDGYYQTINGGSLNIHPFTETCERSHINIPIAVITGPFTASSAEGLAIILKNRPNTILIGEPTAGWVSGVLGLKVDGNSHINLSIGYMTDVNNKVYKNKIQPDILVESGDNFETLQEDAKIIKALEWLNNR